MAFHEIKIGTKNFTLAPKYIKSPDTAATNADYGFLLFKYDESDSSISQLYSPGVNDLPIIKYSSGNFCLDCNILPDTPNTWNIGLSNKKFGAMYATTFHGNLNGNASSANKVLITTQTASDNFPIIFGQSDSVTSTSVKSVHADAHLNYNPATNVLTTTTFKGDLDGTATYANYTHILPMASANATYYVTFAEASNGKRMLCADTTLLYNPSTNTLTAPKIKYTSTAQQWIGGKTLTNNAFYPSNNFTTTAFFPILAAKTSGENVISLGGLGDQYGFFGYKKDTTENKTDWHFKWDSNNGNTYVTGKIYGTATHADNINVSAATANATYYVSFVNGTSGARIPYTDAGLYYNPSTNELSAGGGFYERSDERLKDFQEDIEVNFSYLHNIPKKYYSWKDDTTYTRHIGTSAQEVQKYYPELVNADENGYLTMNYDKLSVVALKAIDVLHEEVAELKKENAELKERLARLEELILNK